MNLRTLSPESPQASFPIYGRPCSLFEENTLPWLEDPVTIKDVDVGDSSSAFCICLACASCAEGRSVLENDHELL